MNMLSLFNRFENELDGMFLGSYEGQTDVIGISDIVNTFMEHVFDNPDSFSFICTPTFNSNYLYVSYEPYEQSTYRFEHHKNTRYEIILCEKINENNYMSIKIDLINELVNFCERIRWLRVQHIWLSWKKHRWDLMNQLDVLSHIPKSKMIMTLLWRDMKYEIPNWFTRCYTSSLHYKLEHPNMSDGEITNFVLHEAMIDDESIKSLLDMVNKDDDTFKVILYILITHLSKFSSEYRWLLFDDDIFDIPVIKNMDNTTYLKEKEFSEDFNKSIDNLINENIDELNNIRPLIIKSFTNHLEKWLYESQTNIKKIIQLGILGTRLWD